VSQLTPSTQVDSSLEAPPEAVPVQVTAAPVVGLSVPDVGSAACVNESGTIVAVKANAVRIASVQYVLVRERRWCWER